MSKRPQAYVYVQCFAFSLIELQGWARRDSRSCCTKTNLWRALIRHEWATFHVGTILQTDYSREKGSWERNLEKRWERNKAQQLIGGYRYTGEEEDGVGRRVDKG